MKVELKRLRTHRDSGDVAIQPVELILPQSFSPACSACTQPSQHECIRRAQIADAVHNPVRLVWTSLRGVLAILLLCPSLLELSWSYWEFTRFLPQQVLSRMCLKHRCIPGFAEAATEKVLTSL